MRVNIMTISLRSKTICVHSPSKKISAQRKPSPSFPETMSRISRAQQGVIDASVAAGIEPRETRAGQIILPHARGAGFNVLVMANGTVTSQGTYYYRKVGREPPRRGGLNMNQTPTQIGGSTYIEVNGRRTLASRLAANGEFQATAIGRRWFGRTRSEFIVHLPVRVHGHGRVWTSRLPINKLGLEVIFETEGLTPEQVTARVKAEVLAGLNVDQPLFTQSEQEYFYDDSREWLISERAMGMRPDGTLQTRVTLNRPLSQGLDRPLAGLLSCAESLPFPAEKFCDEAFETHPDKLCVPRQIAVLTGLSLEVVCSRFDDVLECTEWRCNGISANQIQQYCNAHGHVFYHVVDGRLLPVFQPESVSGRPLCMVSHDGHAYFLKDARTVCQWRPCLAEESDQEATLIWNEPRPDTSPPTSEWLPWNGVPAPGHYFAECLEDVRAQLLRSNRSPKVMLSNLHSISSLRYQCLKRVDGCSGLCVIRETPGNLGLIAHWIARLKAAAPTALRDFEWRGQRLPALACSVFNALLRAQRRYPSVAVQKAILEAQKDRCNLCDEALTPATCEWDHVVPLHQLVTTSEQVFQALCSLCHSEKTLYEGHQHCTLESAFSRTAWDSYVMSPHPCALTFNPREWQDDPALNKMEIDIIRCRRNALRHCLSIDIPVFSPLDNIEPATSGQLADFSFVQLHGKSAKRCALGKIPFTCTGWYHKIAVAFMLHHGLITWQDIEYSFNATSKVSASCLEPVLDLMETCWLPENAEQLEGQAKLISQHQKDSINSMIGIWRIPEEQYVYKVRSTRSNEDGAGRCFMRYTTLPNGELLFDHIFGTRLHINRSMRPVHDLIMAQEHVLLGHLLYVLQRNAIPPACIVSVKTDCLILQKYPRKKQRFLYEMVSNLRYQDLAGLQSQYEPFKNCVGGIIPLDYSHRSQDDSRVFRSDSEKARPLRGRWCTPHIEAEAPRVPDDWRNVPLDQCEQLLDTGALICGPPGAGKTYEVVHRVILPLHSQKHRVFVISKCHTAVRNLSREIDRVITSDDKPCVMTADAFVNRHIRHGQGGGVTHLICDEVSQINSQIWVDLALLARKNVVFFFMGDWAQFGVINHTFAGCLVPEGKVEASQLLLELAGGNLITLNQNRRSDPPLYAFYSSIRVNRPDELAMKLDQARQLFPYRRDKPADISLVISHQHRMRINKRENERLKPEGAVLISAAPSTRQLNASQDMWIWPGMKLVGSGGRHCLKGCVYTVQAVTNEELHLEGGKILTHEQASKALRLYWSITYTSCQSLSLEGVVRLCDTNNDHFTLKHLYVGVSRCTKSCLLEVI